MAKSKTDGKQAPKAAGDFADDREGRQAQLRVAMESWPVKEVLLEDLGKDGNSRLPSPARLAKLKALGESMKRLGQLQEACGFKGIDGKTHLVWGFGRAEAKRLAGLKTLRTRVSPSILSREEVELLRGVENIHRLQLNDAELALQVKNAVDAAALAQGLKGAMEAVAEEFTLTIEQVQDCVHVVERLEPKVREMLRDGRLTLVQARELATIGGVDQLEVAEEVAGELEEALDVRRDRGLVGGRRMTRDEIRGLIANRQQSLKVVPWKLELPMKTGVPGCETCRGCKFNTATDNVLFDMGQQDGKDGAGFCRLPAGFEAKQKLAQKVHVTMVKEVREKIKKKQVEKADAASAAVVRQVAPSFMKEASIQRVLKKELGAGEGKTPAAKPEKKPETPAEKREAARWKWADAYNSWIQNVEQKFEKHVAADPFRKLAWIMLAHGRVAIPRFDANNPGKDGWPAEEKLIGPAASRLLVLANGVASGLLHKEEIKELAGEIDYPQENWWDVQECCSLQAMGPVMVKSFVKAFGFELPSAPPRFEDFLPEDLRPPEPVMKAAPAPSVKPSPAGPKALCDPGQLLAHKRHKIVAESIGMASNLEVSVRLADGKETRWAVGEVRKPTEAEAIKYSDSLQPAPLGGGG